MDHDGQDYWDQQEIVHRVNQIYCHLHANEFDAVHRLRRHVKRQSREAEVIPCL